jgi:hypothetical protein
MGTLVCRLAFVLHPFGKCQHRTPDSMSQQWQTVKSASPLVLQFPMTQDLILTQSLMLSNDDELNLTD